MKKIVSLLCILSICSLSFAVYQDLGLYKTIDLQAAYGEVSTVSITRIPAQSTAYKIGMPFDIEDRFVLNTADAHTERGRVIASWRIVSNTNYKLRISAENLHHETSTDVQLPYILTFTYKLGYFDGDNREEYDESEFSLTTGNNPSAENGIVLNDDNKYEFSIIPAGLADGGTNYTGSVDGNIYFLFTRESSERILGPEADNANSPDYVPAGNYTASVTIEMISEG